MANMEDEVPNGRWRVPVSARTIGFAGTPATLREMSLSSLKEGAVRSWTGMELA